LVPWCSSCKGLICRRALRTGKSHGFISYKRLVAFAKLATS
jgi:hypothetical protein